MATKEYEKKKAAIAEAAKKSDAEYAKEVRSKSSDEADALLKKVRADAGLPKKKAPAAKKPESTQAEMDKKAAKLAKIMRSKKDK